MVGIGQLTVLTRLSLGLACLSLHWDYRRHVLFWTVLPVVCNWDPGWQVSFVRPSTLAGLGGDRYRCQHIGVSCHLHALPRSHSQHQLAASLWPVGLGAVDDILALAKRTKLDLLGSRAALCLSFGKKGVRCCLFSSWRQPVLRRWVLVRAVIMRQNGDVIY